MKYARAAVLCLIAGGLISFPNPCWPVPSWRENWEISFAGGSISPAAPNDSIRLDSMEVTIRLKRHSYTVDAVFHLFNTGDTTTERVGLPKHCKLDGWQHERRPQVHDFIRFDAWVDGRKAEFREERDFLTDPSTSFPKPPQGNLPMQDTRWMVKEITFPAHALAIIRIRYEASYQRSGPSMAMEREWGEYYYGTIRYWKGTVGKAAFTIDGTDVDPKNAWVGFATSPGPRVITERIQRCERGEFEPPVKAQLLFGPGPF